MSEAVEGRAAITRRLIGYLNVLLRHRWLVILLPIVAAAFSIVTNIRKPPSYTATARFMTEGTGARPQAVGLAAQLGVNLGPISDPSVSPDFYSDLLTSDPIIEHAVHTIYTSPADSAARRLAAQHFRSEKAAAGRLSGITSSIAPKTGIVTFSVRAPEAELARVMSGELIHQLEEFNRARRQSRAAAERRFTEGRLAEVTTELRASEEALTDFLAHNRGFERSPELSLTQERLAREIARRQQVYTSVAQAFEQAKIDEVRETPVITVLEEAQLPGPDSLRIRDRAVLAAAIGFILAVMLSFAWEAWKRTNLTEIDEFSETRVLGRELLYDFRNPVRAARRFLS